MKKLSFVFYLMAAFLFCAQFAFAASPPLKKGINISSWYANATGRQILGPRDIRELSTLGFDFVRFPVNPEFIGFNLDDETPKLDEQKLGRLDAIFDMLRANNLDIILDVHPETDFMKRLEESGEAKERFTALWRILAARYARYDAQHFALELLNEPAYYKKSGLYNAFIARLAGEVRKLAPDHLIIIGTPGVMTFKPADALRVTDKVHDDNIAYAVHYYQPYIISHQGMPFGFEKKQIPYISGLAYPVDNVWRDDVMFAQGADIKKAETEIDEYVKAGWNAKMIEADITAASAQAHERGMRLLALEYGVYRPHIDAASRYRWIKDVRVALDKNNIGWAYWDYSDVFGIMTLRGKTITSPTDGSVRFADDAQTNQRVVEQEAIDALALNKP